MLEEIEPDESRKHACGRLAPKLSVKAVTLYNWVKHDAPGPARPSAVRDPIEEFREQNATRRLEGEPRAARDKAILQDAAASFGATLDRQRR